METHLTPDCSWQGNYLRVRIPFSRAGVGQHVIVSSDDVMVLIDTGDGVLRDLLLNEVLPQDVEGIFYTHGHFDHMGGLHSLLGFMRMVGRKRVLRIYCPEGCGEVINALEAFGKSYPDSLPFEVELVELCPGQVVNLAGLSVEAIGMIHCGSIEGAEVLNPIPALGYKIEGGGEKVAVTGDCGRESPIAQLVTGVDLAVIEGTYERSDGKKAALLDNVHLSEDLSREYGELAKDFVIVHRGRRPDNS